MAETDGSLESHFHADAVSLGERKLEDENPETFDDLHLMTGELYEVGGATTPFADRRYNYEVERSRIDRCSDSSSTSLDSPEGDGIWPSVVLVADPPRSNGVTLGVSSLAPSFQLHSRAPTSADGQLQLRLNAAMHENDGLKYDCSVLAKENCRLSRDVESLHDTLMTVQSGLIEFRNERSEMSDKIAMLSKEVAQWKEIGLRLNASARGDAADDSPDLAELQKRAKKLPEENTSQRNEQLEVLQNVRCLSERQARHLKSKIRRANRKNARSNMQKLELRKRLLRDQEAHKAREVELQAIIEKTAQVYAQLCTTLLEMRVHRSSSDSDIPQIEKGENDLETTPRPSDSAKQTKDAVATEGENAVCSEEADAENAPKEKLRRSRLSRFFGCFVPNRN